MDNAAEGRYDALRARLVDLHYYQPLSIESTQLVEKILGDLVKSVESFQTLKQRHLQMTNVPGKQTETAELSRVEAANNELHKRLIAAKEEQEKCMMQAQLETQQLRDQIDDHKVSLAAEAQRWRQVMRENEVLKQKVRDLVQISKLESQSGPPSTISGDLMAEFKAAAAVKGLSQQDNDQEARLIALAQELQAAQKTIASCDRAKIEAEKKLANAEKRVAADAWPDAEEKRMAKRATQLESQVDFLNTHYEQLNRKHSALQEECRKRDHDAKELALEREKLEQTVAGLEEDLKRQQRGALTTMNQTHAASFESLKQQEEQKAQIANLMQIKDRLGGEIKFYKEEKEASDQFRRHEVESLEEKLREQIRSKSATVGEMESRLHEMRIESERAATALRSFEVQKEDMEARLQFHESTALHTTKERTELKEEIGQLTSSKQAAQARIVELESRVRGLAESLDTLSGDKKALAEFLEDKRIFSLANEKEEHQRLLERAELSVQIAQFDVTRQGLLDDIAQQKTQRMHLDRELQFLKETEVPQLRKLTQKLQTELVTAEELAKVVQEQHRELSSDYDKVSNELYSLRVDRQKCEDDVFLEQKEKKQKIGSLEKRISELENELWGARRLENEVEKLQEMDREKTAEMAREKETLLAQVRFFEDEMSRIHCRVADLSADREDLRVVSATAGAKAAEKEQLLSHLGVQFEEVVDQRESEKTRTQNLQGELTQLRELLQQKDRDAARLEEWGRMHEANEVKEQALVCDLRQKCTELEAERGRCLAEVRVRAAQEEHLQQECALAVQGKEDMEKQVIQLTSLLNALEQTREQLVVQIRDTQDLVDHERGLRQDVITAAATQSGDVTSLQQQVDALTEALAGVDAERDELQNDADKKSEEVAHITDQLLREREALEKCQCALEDARRSCDFQTKELLADEEQLQLLHSQDEQWTEAMAHARAELEARQREKLCLEEDLRNMIRENQIINERMQALQNAHESASTKVDDSARENERQVATLRATVMERDDVLEMYRASVETTHRQQAQIESLLNEKEDLIETLHDEQLRRQNIEKRHESTATDCRDSHLDIMTLQQQTSQLTRQCEDSAREREKMLQECQRAGHDLALADGARRETETRRAKLERDLVLVHQQFEAEVRKSESLHAQKSEADAYAREEQAKAQQLGELLAMERTGGRQSPPDMHAMHKTLDSQYAVIAEMDEDLRRLREELKTKTIGREHLGS